MQGPSLAINIWFPSRPYLLMEDAFLAAIPFQSHWSPATTVRARRRRAASHHQARAARDYIHMLVAGAGVDADTVLRMWDERYGPFAAAGGWDLDELQRRL